MPWDVFVRNISHLARFRGAEQGFVGRQEEVLRGLPGDAFIRYRDPVLEVRRIFGGRLLAFEQVAFKHHTNQGIIPVHALVKDVSPDDRLILMSAPRIVVRAVDQDGLRQVFFLQQGTGVRDADGIVVGPFPPAQHEMRIRVPGRLNDAGCPVLVDAQETLR